MRRLPHLRFSLASLLLAVTAIACLAALIRLALPALHGEALLVLGFLLLVLVLSAMIIAPGVRALLRLVDRTARRAGRLLYHIVCRDL